MLVDNRYEINTYKIIGIGQHSKVFPCVDKDNLNLKLAAKLIGSNYKEILKKEYQIQNSLQIFLNQHILKCYQLCHHEDNFVIIMEYCELGDLSKKIKEMKNQNQRYNANQILDFLYQIVDGLYLLYQNNIFHRDMKPQNILLTKDNKNNILYKICDFGAARIVKDMKKEDNYTAWHTPNYQSPEIYNKEKFSSQSDIFSFGIVLYELCFLELPYKTNKQQEFFIELQKNIFQINMNNIKGEIKELNFIQFILENIIVYQQQNRLDWKDLYTLITDFRQSSQIYQDQYQQNDNYIIAKQHINLLISKQRLIINLMIQFKLCYHKKLINVSDNIFKLSFTTLACCKYILILSIIAFIHNDYKKLSQNIQKIIVKDKFQDLSKTYQQQLTQEDYDNIKFIDNDLQNDEYTEGMVHQAIKMINNMQNVNQFKSLLERLNKFSAYLKNSVDSIDYEEFLHIQNEIYQNQIEQQIPQENAVGNIIILLALWRAYSQSEVFYPQSECNFIQNFSPQIKVSFNEDEALQFLQNDQF